MSAPVSQPSSFSEGDRATLLRVAMESIRHGLDYHRPLPIDPLQFPPALREERASFVTLRIGTDLRGCIGVLQARRPLIEDVADNAFSAAFRDTRFTPLTDYEFLMLGYHVSVLSPPMPMSVTSEEDLLAQVRPGIDGLIIEEGARRATFLPEVWESVPDARQFLAHLKMKGGWPVDYWSSAMRVSRYTSEGIE